jgi:replicative DNA helicase
MSGLNATKINTGDMDGDDFRALIDAVEKTGELPLYIDDSCI